MAVATVPMVPRDGTLSLKDATGTPIECTIAYEDGDLQIDGFEEAQYSAVAFRDRGKTYALRKADDIEQAFSFTCHATQFSDATEKLILDAIRKTGAFASGVSTLPNANGGQDVWTLTLTFTAERSNYGATTDSSVVLKYCRCKVAFAEGIPGKLTITGIAYNISTDGLTIAA